MGRRRAILLLAVAHVGAAAAPGGAAPAVPAIELDRAGAPPGAVVRVQGAGLGAFAVRRRHTGPEVPS
jgi:hypothetical protein